ncbi:hypothetical protein [Aquimarina agarivorans]|uniref:hypothetical protein n=1 Tax=Aquimarina agarivorans TaxID=980584 RepID=UPI000248F02A|nr:hypothetical protein [Aquimarina agarivorans]
MLKLFKYVAILIYYFSIVSFQSQEVSKKNSTDWKKYSLKEKVKKVLENYYPTIIGENGKMEFLDIAKNPKERELGSAFGLNFNERGFLIKHDYRVEMWYKDVYEYTNDTILKKKSKYLSKIEDNDSFPNDQLEESIEYDEDGNITKLIFYLEAVVGTHIDGEYFFKYDQFNNCKKVIQNYYEYKPKTEFEVLEILESNYQFKNTYKDTLLISKQFLNSKGEVLALESNGEVSESNYGKSLQSFGPDRNKYTAGDKITYEYDNRGNKIKVTSTSAHGKSSYNTYKYYPDNSLKEAYYRDTNENIIAGEMFDQQGRRTHIGTNKGNFSYTYTKPDAHGNWTICEIRKLVTSGLYKDNVHYYIKRTIEYYE